MTAALTIFTNPRQAGHAGRHEPNLNDQHGRQQLSW